MRWTVALRVYGGNWERVTVSFSPFPPHGSSRVASDICHWCSYNPSISDVLAWGLFMAGLTSRAPKSDQLHRPPAQICGWLEPWPTFRNIFNLDRWSSTHAHILWVIRAGSWCLGCLPHFDTRNMLVEDQVDWLIRRTGELARKNNNSLAHIECSHSISKHIHRSHMTLVSLLVLH